MTTINDPTQALIEQVVELDIQLRGRLPELQQEVASLQTKLADQTRANETVEKRLRIGKSRLRKSKAKLTKVNTELTKVNTELNNDLTKVRGHLAKLQHDFTQLQRENALLQQENNNQRLAIKTLQALDAARVENVSLLTQLAVAKQQLSHPPDLR
jgi:chromosome segregation ATPase